MRYSQYFQCLVSTLSLVALSSTGQAITINVDGANHTKLSTAVAAAYLSDDGPDIINLNVNSLPDADTQILLDKPIVINGNGNNDSLPCDLLVDMAGIQGQLTFGDAGKSYIEILAIGDVQINNLQIHPNGDGAFSTTVADLVTGIRMNKPSIGVGNYTLTEVHVSGSTSANAYIPLDTGDDLYATAGVKRWGGLSGTSDANIGGYGVIQLTNGGGSGIYNSVLDHCDAGLGYGGALNILAVGAGTHTVIGGVYGHVGRDGIRVEGENVTLRGTHDDRLRIVRATNIGAANSHCLEVVGASATVPLIEYVDAVGVNTANNFALRGGTIALIRYCRGFGKMVAGRNETVFHSGSNVAEISNCTFHANGTEVGFTNGVNPLSVTLGVTNPVIIKDSIFTSFQNGFINIAPTTASLIVNFTNCALPTDGLSEESLAAWPFGSSVGGATVVAPISVSPDYRLTLDDYDWSDNQGHNQTDNARGNLNVLRPTNAAYSGASSTLGQLNGGAGAPAAGIEQSVWMLM